MPPVFDEQVRHLGPRLKILDPGDTDDVLREGGCAFVLSGQLLSIGFTSNRAIANAEVARKCVQAYTLAADSRKAAVAWSRGEVPLDSGGY